MQSPLPLHQEFMLLALNDDRGSIEGNLPLYGVAGAMLSELLLQNRIEADTEGQSVSVVDPTATGDDVLDELLQLIDASTKSKALKHWVSKAAHIKDLKHRIAQRLCEIGILEPSETKVLFLFTKKTYPELDGTYEDSIRSRMSAVMFNADTLPDERTAVLIAFAKHCSLLNVNFDKADVKTHKDRIKELAEGKILASGATKKAIEAVQAAVMVAVMTSAFVATMN